MIRIAKAQLRSLNSRTVSSVGFRDLESQRKDSAHRRAAANQRSM